MSWFDKILPPGLKRSNSTSRAKQVPEGLWVKCPACDAVLYSTELEKNLNVCPKCEHHMRLRARLRLERLLDTENRKELGQDVRPVDALKFKDSRKYTDRLSQAASASGETDALVVMEGTLEGLPVVAACFEFDFMGGSMGSVVGERFARGVERALEKRCPFISIAASGGARMQEGLLSLMQMAKTTAALSRLGAERLRRPSLRLGADRPYHGWCLGQLRLPGGCGDCRTQRAGGLCRSARDRADGAREAAAGLPAGRVPAGEGGHRHDRAPS